MGKKLWTLFYEMLIISACTFGGGYVITSLMRQRFVEKRGYLADEEMLEMIALAQSAPGAIVVNASILVGYRIAGVPGAALLLLGAVLPPLCIISVISYAYEAFRDSAVVAALMRGARAGVAAVVCDVTWELGEKVVRGKKALHIAVMAVAFVLVFFLKVGAVYIIVGSALIGLAAFLWNGRRGKGARAQ